LSSGLDVGGLSCRASRPCFRRRGCGAGGSRARFREGGCQGRDADRMFIVKRRSKKHCVPVRSRLSCVGAVGRRSRHADAALDHQRVRRATQSAVLASDEQRNLKVDPVELHSAATFSLLVPWAAKFAASLLTPVLRLCAYAIARYRGAAAAADRADGHRNPVVLGHPGERGDHPAAAGIADRGHPVEPPYPAHTARAAGNAVEGDD
jgi:hypothetical protein